MKKTHALTTEWRLLQIALLVLSAFIVYSLYEERIQIEAVESERLQAQARVLGENLERQLSAVSYALADVLEDVPTWDRKTPWASAMTHRLKDLAGTMPGLRTILIVDANGAVMASNRDELSVNNVSEREYFKVAHGHPDPAMLYVSPPFKTPLGATVINMGRAAIGPSGALAGLASAALNPEYFSGELRTLLYAPDMRVGLAHGGGSAFLILSQDSQSPQVDLAQHGEFLSAHLASKQTSSVLTGVSRVSGEERMAVERTINPPGLHMDVPLIVSVGRSVSAIYAPWRKRALELGGLFGAIAFASCFGLYTLQRRWQMSQRHKTKAEEGYQKLKLVLDSADLGLWDWDLQSGKIAFDDSWRTMLGYDYGELALDINNWHKLVHPDDLAVMNGALNSHLKGETPEYEARYRMRHKNGGWVWILGRGRIIKRNEAGAPILFTGTHVNLTEAKAQ
jgi:PAS domain S-box-containing protein